MKRLVLGLGVTAALGWFAVPALAQPAPAPSPPLVRAGGTAPLLLIFDSSGSMRGDDGSSRPKIVAAKEALTRLVDELPEGTPVGLRVYGHRVPNTDRERGCADTELIQPVGPLDREGLKAKIAGLQATGFTPIGTSLVAALGDLPQDGPRTVVLISDGIDTCAPPDPCTTAERLAASNVELRVETVGFQVDPQAADELACIADVTGGRFRSVDDSGGLLRALREYRVAGSPVSGGATVEEAPLLDSGQYRDNIQVGQQRWYAMELEEGQVLRATATVVGEPGGEVAPEATVSAELMTDDVLGVLSCGRDEAARLGQEARQVGVDGLDTSEAGICREPGRYALRVELADPAGESSVLAGRTFDLELLVSIVDRDEPDPQAAPDPVLQPDQELLATEPTRPGGVAYVTAGLGAGLLGALVGAVLARRVGP